MQGTRESGRTRPLRADAARNRAQILDAARDVFVEQGAGAPLEEISRRAGCGIATLYRRFPDRQSLMRAVVVDAIERTAEEARLALAEEPDAFSALTRYMHRTLDVRIAAVVPTLLNDVAMDEEGIRRVSDLGTEYLQQTIDTAQADGTLRPDVTFGDIGVMLIRLSRPLPGPFSRDLNDRLAHRHLELLIGGLRADGADRPAVGGPGMTLEDLRGLDNRELFDERPVGTEHAELVALGIGKDNPTHIVALSDVDRPRAECDDALYLGVLIVGVEIDVEAILRRLLIEDTDEAQAGIIVRVAADDDLVGGLGFVQDRLVENGRPESGQRLGIMCVDDELVEARSHRAMVLRTHHKNTGRPARITPSSDHFRLAWCYSDRPEGLPSASGCILS
jgi:AcrR family transcriptional regulator